MSDDLDDLFGSDEEETVSETPEGVVSKTTSTRPASNGPVTFHNGTETSLLLYVERHAKRGDPSSVLAAVDTFCWNSHWMMHLGDQKRDLLVSYFQNAQKRQSDKPIIALEFGSYCGYSAVVLAQSMRSNDHLYCIELYPECANFAKRLIDYAGLSDKVTVIVCAAGDISIWSKEMDENHLQSGINFVLLDHDKASYANDITKLLEFQLNNKRILCGGSTIIADNVLSLGKPLQEYFDCVRPSLNENEKSSSITSKYFESSELIEGFLEYTTEEERQLNDYRDGMEISILRDDFC